MQGLAGKLFVTNHLAVQHSLSKPLNTNLLFLKR